ncbi:MAG TPA: hypothetical protein VEY50_11530 [Lysobacter sp.]|nr:hypothetical protein [Lysobacter sp.]
MLRRTVSLVIALGLASVAFGAAAANTAPQTPSDDSAAAKAEPDKHVDRNCLRYTGSRLVHRDRDGRCAAAAGRVYTRDDIDSTGAVNIGDALRRLDPSIR